MQEILLHDMDIIIIDGYCDARVHASMTPTVPHESSIIHLHGIYCWLHVVLLHLGHITAFCNVIAFCNATAFCNITTFCDVTTFCNITALWHKNLDKIM